MALYRVQVAGVSQRYVDAQSPAEAVELVSEAVLRSLHVTAYPAAKVLADDYEASGPIRRKRLLAALDGLDSPVARRSARGDIHRLYTLLAYDAEVRAWVTQQVAHAPPVPNPDVLERLLLSTELEAVERQRALLRHADKPVDPYR